MTTDFSNEQMNKFLKGKFILAGTGTRSVIKLPGSVQEKMVGDLAGAFVKGQKKYGERLVIMSGGAEGWDEFIAAAAVEANVPFVLVLPNIGYGPYYWEKNSQTGHNRRYEFDAMYSAAKRVEYAAESLYVTKDGRRYHSNFYRNDVMVAHVKDEDGLFWAYPGDKDSRGTEHCIREIQRQGVNWNTVAF